MENPEVAQMFEEVAYLLEIQGANPFRVRAYRNAAHLIRDLSEPLAALTSNGRRLDDLSGIGKDLAAKIQTILATGDLPLRQELRSQVPPGLRELLNVPALGPKRALQLFQQLKINSIDSLRAAAQAQRIRPLRGFGAKTEQKILQALEHVEQTGKRVILAEAKVYADAVVRHMHGTPGLKQIEIAGSFRRRQETIGDLDVLVTCRKVQPVMDRLAAYDGVAEVQARGDTKMTVRLKNGMQMDLRAVPEQSYGAALQYFTGSKSHSIQLRRRAQDRGLKINEYGVFRGKKRIAGRSEKEIYDAVGLPWIPPELREARGEIELAEQRKLPKLVELDDLRGDLHMHTDVTDGRASIEQMIHAAKKRGLEYIAITDHSKRVSMAKGLDAKQLRKHWKDIDRIAGRINGITVLKGVEVDILENETLDLSDDVLSEADWVVASIHYGQNQPRDKLTRRLVHAIKSPHVDAIGHPTGRLIGRRRGYEIDLETVLEAAADYECFFETNAQPDRLDLDDVFLMAAKDRGIPIVINTDAHSVEELGFLEFGVFQARRGRLENRDVVNTRTLAQLRKMMKKS